MDAEQRLGLAENIPRLRAARDLDRARMGEVRLTADGWFDLTLAATGDRDAAESAHYQAAMQAYRENRPPQ